MTKPNQAELARRAGVSQATVSRCLRNDPAQTPAMRERILKMAATLGYVPNTLAASLARARTSNSKSLRANLAVIGGNPGQDPVASWKNWSLFLSAARQHASQQGYSLDYFWRYAPGRDTAKLRRIIETRGVLGLVLLMITPEELDLPWERLALCSARVSPSPTPRTHYVGSNDYHSVCEALRECARLGYKRPGLAISYSSDKGQAEGAITAAFLFHLKSLPARQRIPPYDSKDNDDDADFPRFLAWFEKYRPDVLLAHHGFYIQRLKKRVSRKLGFVNLSGLDYGPPNCTHIGCRTDLMGIAAIDVVTGQLNRHERGWPEHPRCLMVPSSWTAGATTGPVRDRT